jgi:hypothetical protein
MKILLPRGTVGKGKKIGWPHRPAASAITLLRLKKEGRKRKKRRSLHA